ncbi:MAG: formate dehydrogenase accessory sulfurtransferase FdhD [Fimbriiglobus sp.]
MTPAPERLTLGLPAGRRPPAGAVDVVRVVGTTATDRADVLAVEEPLEICVVAGPAGARVRRTLSVTMRTPGHDAELAVGFLYSEGVIRSAADVIRAEPCGPDVGPDGTRNVVRVELAPHVAFDPGKVERHVATTSACGVCGKTSLDALEAACQIRPPVGYPVIPAAVIHTLPGRLRDAQPAFERTGGIHAAGLFSPDGTLLAVREDVGRHNAVDKLIGAELLAGRLPLSDRVLLVSGRASFELAQKAAAAGVPILAAVGAPSTLAVAVARRFGLTLLGFVRDGRFNVYCGRERICV